MRLKKRILAEIDEYLRLHYAGDGKRVQKTRAPSASVPTRREPKIPALLSAERTANHAVPIDEYAVNQAPTQPDRAQRIAAQRDSAPVSAPGTQDELAGILRQMDESFQQALLRMIDERGMKDSTCYKRAGVDRKLFSKIRSNPDYRPSKPTAVAFAIALELNLNETADFLRKAGYALSHSSRFDVIVEYFIVKGRYNLRELNEALYEFDQPLIGC